jgi:hypothetical protein
MPTIQSFLNSALPPVIGKWWKVGPRLLPWCGPMRLPSRKIGFILSRHNNQNGLKFFNQKGCSGSPSQDLVETTWNACWHGKPNAQFSMRAKSK